MKTAALLSLVPFVAAFPRIAELNNLMEKRATTPAPRAPLFKSGRQNTGVAPPLDGFNAEDQYVDVSPGSANEFVAPGPNDLRGQCPGLNAAANHGFIPHNGIVSTQQTIDGLAAAYNMGPDLALFLAAVSEGLSGDIVKQTWSIGGAMPNTLPTPATGIVGTHSQYESDASIVRGDAYLNGGKVFVFQMDRFERFYNLAEEYNLDHAADQSDYVTRYSIENNPYYFSAPFAGLVSPAAHNFVVNFMSNRSEASPGGVLDRNVLKQFFAVTGEPGSFTHNIGMERIPEQWYKRPTSNQYNIPEVLADVFVNNAMYPGIVRFGGNTGKVNSFAGVDVTDLTGGAMNLEDLSEGNNGACFFMQAATQGLPDAADPLLSALGGTVKKAVGGMIAPLMSKLSCPQLADFDTNGFENLPGAKYKANGQSTSFLSGLLGN